MGNPETVLISGVNGFIAAQIAVSFLKAGYKVRGSVRSKASAGELLDFFKDEAREGKFELVEVPDITADGAFDEAVKGVAVIAHTASPVSFAKQDPDPVLRAAVRGTESILESAGLHAGPQLRAVVLASSAMAVASPDKPREHVFTEADWNEYALEQVRRLGLETPGNVTYAASKTAAEKAFWIFREEKRPNFAMVAINPALVYGPPAYLPPSPSKLSISTKPIWTIFSGGAIPAPLGGTGTAVDVRDVARLFVFFSSADKAAAADGQRYLAVGGIAHPQAVADILYEAFPDRRGALQRGQPGVGYEAEHVEAGNGRVDASKAARETGQGWIGLRQSVVDTAKALEGFL